MKGSWKTTVAGVVAIIGGGITQFFPQYANIGQFMVYIGTGFGFLVARDNNVSSEAAGAKKE
jgi:hypothetical protein